MTYHYFYRDVALPSLHPLKMTYVRVVRFDVKIGTFSHLFKKIELI